MYWIYLIIFTLIVFVPTFVRSGFYIFNMTQAQEFVILFLGSLAFSIFLLMEKKMKKNLAEKSIIQGQANRMAKDLRHSYSYIGEINRKLDILENIALGYPESSKLSHKNESELYDSIMSAIRLFGKSEQFALRFVCLPEYTLLKEIQSNPGTGFNFSLENRKIEVNYFESAEFIVVTSPKAIDNIFSYIVIKKETPSQKLDDVEIMKTLVAQALFIFMFMRHKKQIKCVI
ncbi:MAG: hypothetical protein US70_C0008G0005 [Parcubacteria group bacterium GW2011_GWD2_38_11]|nr:MAG: hypothetical protein US70_C0008G0005 [Parcubacteria group bacterium GW2011_GWD2_38_11]